MLLWLTLGATLGLDSMRASAVLGLRGVGGLDRIFLPLAFGTADGLATAAGLWLGRPVVDALESGVQFAAAAVLVGYGLSLLIPRYARTTAALAFLALAVGAVAA